MPKANCQIDVQGLEYYTLDFEYLTPYYGYLLQLSTEIIILLFYMQKIEHYTNREEKLRIFRIKIVMTILTALSGLVYLFGGSMPLHNILFIIFLGFHT